jgi:hypothetical protein
MDEPTQLEQSPPIPRTQQKSGRRRYTMFMAIMGVVFITAVYATIHTPGWYELPVILPPERQAVRNNLVAAEQAFTESLLAGTPFIYHLFDEDVNRWISMRREIYPLLDELVPPELGDPLVFFHAGSITLAGKYKLGGVDYIVSLDMMVRMEGGEIVLRAGALRCGSMRLPLGIIDKALSRKVDKSRDRVWPGSPPIRGDLKSGLRLDAVARWKNGGMEYRVRDIKIQSGKLDLDIEPLARQSRTHRSSQS